MRNIIVIGFLILFIIGCSSTKKITSSVTRSDSVSQSQTTQYKDTSVAFHIQGQNVQAKSNVNLPDSLNKLSSLIRYLQLQLALKGDKQDYHIVTGLLNSDESYLKCPYAQAWAQVIDGVLHHHLEQTDTTIDIRLKNAIRLTNYFYSRYKSIVSEKETVKTSFWAEVWIWIRGILIGIAIAFLFWLILKIKSNVL